MTEGESRAKAAVEGRPISLFIQGLSKAGGAALNWSQDATSGRLLGLSPRRDDGAFVFPRSNLVNYPLPMQDIAPSMILIDAKLPLGVVVSLLSPLPLAGLLATTNHS